MALTEADKKRIEQLRQNTDVVERITHELPFYERQENTTLAQLIDQLFKWFTEEEIQYDINYIESQFEKERQAIIDKGNNGKLDGAAVKTQLDAKAKWKDAAIRDAQLRGHLPNDYIAVAKAIIDPTAEVPVDEPTPIKGMEKIDSPGIPTGKGLQVADTSPVNDANPTTAGTTLKDTINEKGQADAAPLWGEDPTMSKQYMNKLIAGTAGAFNYEDKNLVRGDPSSNVNGLDPSKTIALERVRNALNNQRYKTRGQIGVEGGQWGNRELSGGTWEKKDDITTMEQKQVEQMYKNQADTDSARIQQKEVAWRGQAAKIAEMEQLEKLSQYKALTQEQQRRYNELWDEIYRREGAERDFYWDRMKEEYTKWMTEYAFPKEKAAQVQQLIMKGDTISAAILGEAFNIADVPSPWQIALQGMTQDTLELIAQGKISPQDALITFGQRVNALILSVMPTVQVLLSNIAESTGESAIEIAWGALNGLAEKITNLFNEADKYKQAAEANAARR